MNHEETVSYLSMFDLLAEWIQHLSVLDPKAYASKDARKTIDMPQGLHDEVTLLFDTHPCLKDGKKLVTQGIPENTANEIRIWPYYRSFIHMLEFLARLTRALRATTIIKYFAGVKKRSNFESLNSNVEKTGIQILPRVRSINDPLEPANDSDEVADVFWEKFEIENTKHWATERLTGINEELSGIYYIETEKLTVNGVSFSVMHHFVEGSFFLENKKDILIGVSPISQGDFLDVDYETRTESGVSRNYFNVVGMKNTELVRDRITAAVLKACARNVDILMFPEMLGNSETTNQAFVESVADLALDEGLPMPALILLPTWWHDHSNELYVVDGSGQCVCIQQKQHPFVFPNKEDHKDYWEDLRFNERVVHMLHVPGLGRLTFPICRDYLEPGYLSWLAEVLRSTFLFCPSYSSKKTQFDLMAPGEVKFGCYTVWGNTCAANHEHGQHPSYVGLVSGPMAKGEYIKHLEPKCGGVCGARTDACLFLIHISMDHLAKISCEHIHG